MQTFLLTPLLLEYKDLIVVRISSTNQIGPSLFSDENGTGIQLQSVPQEPPNPLTVIGYDEQSVQL